MCGSKMTEACLVGRYLSSDFSRFPSAHINPFLRPNFSVKQRGQLKGCLKGPPGSHYFLSSFHFFFRDLCMHVFDVYVCFASMYVCALHTYKSVLGD